MNTGVASLKSVPTQAMMTLHGQWLNSQGATQAMMTLHGQWLNSQGANVLFVQFLDDMMPPV